MSKLFRLVKTIGSIVWRFLSHDKTPLGVTILLAVAAAIGTYFLTPSINRAIQQDNARAEHVLKTIDQINTDMIALSASVRSFNFEVEKSKSGGIMKRRDAVLDKISSMQWRLIDVAVITKQDDETEKIAKFRQSLTSLQFSAQDAVVKKKAISAKVLTDLSEAGYEVLEALYKRAGLYEAMKGYEAASGSNVTNPITP